MILPEKNKFYQHRYGGIYTVEFAKAKSTVDKSEWVVYTHVYPFEADVWIRPYSEWVDGRFRPLQHNEYIELIRKDRAEFQTEITSARNAAKLPKEGDVSIVNGKVADYKDGKWNIVQG